MTSVLIDLRKLHNVPSAASVTIATSRRITVNGVDSFIVTGESVSYSLVGGQVTVSLAPTESTWCYVITENTKKPVTRYVIVPDSSTTVNYSTLTDVDPTTLDPTSPTVVNAWDAALQSQIVGGHMDGDNLILVTQSGTEIAAGTVQGAGMFPSLTSDSISTATASVSAKHSDVVELDATVPSDITLTITSPGNPDDSPGAQVVVVLSGQTCNLQGFSSPPGTYLVSKLSTGWNVAKLPSPVFGG